MDAEQAEHFVRSVALGPDSFDCDMVDRAVGKSKTRAPSW
jgi:hypothetical protein